MIIIATLWNRKGWSILRYHINIVAKKFNSKPIKHRHLKSLVKFGKKKIKKKPSIFLTKFECKRLVINFKRALSVVISFKFPLI